MHKIVPLNCGTDFPSRQVIKLKPLPESNKSDNAVSSIKEDVVKDGVGNVFISPTAANIINILNPQAQLKEKKGMNKNWHRGSMTVQKMIENAKMDMRLKKFRDNSRVVVNFKDNSESTLPLQGLINPNAEWRIWWDCLIMFLVFYYAITTPIEVGFTKSPFPHLTLELIFNMMFIIDIILQFFTSFYHTSGPKSGRLETSHSVVAWRYIKSWFLVDMLASIPFSTVYGLIKKEEASDSAGNANKLLRILRAVKLFRVLRANRIFQRISQRAKINSSLLRFFKLIFYLMMEWHFLGCIYWAISEAQGFKDDSWTPDIEAYDWTFGQQYLRALLWAVGVTTGSGEEIPTETDSEISFTIFATIFGVLTYAIIVGSFGSLLQSIQTLEGIKRRNLQQIEEYLHQRNCDHDLVERIKDYYDYCYNRHITTYDGNLLGEMHSTLKKKLNIELNTKLLLSVPRMRDLSENCILYCIENLVSRIYLPGEIVYVDKQRASEMFLVARGNLDQLDQDGNLLRLLSDGAFFGDELLSVSSRRRSTVKSISHCELLILNKEGFKGLLRKFPHFALKIAVWGYGKHIFQSFVQWSRISYVVRMQRTMRRLGSSIGFTQLYCAYGDVEIENSKNENLENEDGEICYMDFRKTMHMGINKKLLNQF